ncbi:MAG: hypothetical protein ACREYE_27570 [Gammaproteobacteria bacterium]
MHVKRQFIEVKSPQVTLELPDTFVNHRVLVTVQMLDEGDRSHPAPLTADESGELLAQTRGAWGHQSLAQVDARIEERRQADWGED